jgi:hypothetical protein
MKYEEERKVAVEVAAAKRKEDYYVPQKRHLLAHGLRETESGRITPIEQGL